VHDCDECLADKALQTVEMMERPVTGVGLTSLELEQQFVEIQSELEKRTERAAKYKRLYLEEKKKNEEITARMNAALKVPLCDTDILGDLHLL